MIAVQFNDVNRAQMGVNVFSVIVCQKSFVELFHNIPEGFLAYYDRKDIDAHLCSIDVIELYSNHLSVHTDTSKERILKEYKKTYKPGEMPRARVTLPLAAAPAAATTSDHPAHSEKFGERDWRLLNERSAASTPTNNNRMVVAKNGCGEAEPLPYPDTFVDAAFYLKLEATIKVISISGWGVFI